MRILYVAPPAVGGIRNHLTGLIRYFSQEHEVMVIAPPDKHLKEAVEGVGGAFQVLDPPPGQLVGLRKWIKSFGPSLLHLHGYKAEMLGRMAAAGLPIPIVVTLHNYLIYPGSRLFFAPLYYYLKRAFPARDRYIAVSGALKEDFLKRSGVNPTKVTVIHNGIAMEPFRRAKPQPELTGLGSPLIGTALRLSRQKGIDVLVQAAPLIFQRYPRTALLVSGEGPLAKQLKDTVVDMGLANRIFFLGFVENLPRFLASLDIFVLPSRTEGLGIILLEALACGVPVVATDVGGIPEIITSGSHGLLVPAQNPAKLAAGIETLWEDQNLRRKLAERGIERIRERFLLQDMHIKTAQVYEDVMRERDRVLT